MNHLNKVLLSAATALSLSPWMVPARAASVDNLEQRVQNLEQQLDATVTAMESGEAADRSNKNRIHIGGYGELHYNNLRTTTAGVKSRSRDIDFHRFVLFFGYDFTDRIRLVSELELEHSVAGESENGEVDLEQAYVEFDLNDHQRAKGGLFLVPVGILNETHEPPAFYGVTRNPIETNIIPSTWWEAGGALSGELAPGWSYDVALHSGLNTTDGDIRGGRQEVSEATANNGAVTGRLKFTGVPGTELAATLQSQSDITQGAGVEQESALLTEVHAIHTTGPFTIKALYALWNIDGAARKAAGNDEQYGFYLEPSWKINRQLGVFARFNQWDNTPNSAADTEEKQTNIGFNYWPHEDIVLKFDIEDYSRGTTDREGFNAGIGFQFH